eukprot:UN04558
MREYGLGFHPQLSSVLFEFLGVWIMYEQLITQMTPQRLIFGGGFSYPFTTPSD